MKSRLLACLALALSAAGAAQAHIQIFSGVLAPEAQGATGSGTTMVTFDDHLFTMRVQADFEGLSGTTTVAHIHGPTPGAGAGNAGVMTGLPTFTNFPAGLMAGSYDMTFDMTDTANYSASFVTSNGGTAAGAFAALLTAVEDGRAYLNIHTSTFGGGEIRAFLAPVPEPSAVALAAGVAILGVAAVRRRRQAA